MDEKFLEMTEEEREAFWKIPDETELPEEAKSCWSAIKAAAEAIGDYCGGMGVPIETEGVSVSAPPEIVEIAKSELSPDKRIAAIAESDWARATAAGTCEKLFGAEPGTPEYERCVEITARRFAEELVGAEAPEWIREIVAAR